MSDAFVIYYDEGGDQTILVGPFDDIEEAEEYAERVGGDVEYAIAPGDDDECE